MGGGKHRASTTAHTTPPIATAHTTPPLATAHTTPRSLTPLLAIPTPLPVIPAQAGTRRTPNLLRSSAPRRPAGVTQEQRKRNRALIERRRLRRLAPKQIQLPAVRRCPHTVVVKDDVCTLDVLTRTVGVRVMLASRPTTQLAAQPLEDSGMLPGCRWQASRWLLRHRLSQCSAVQLNGSRRLFTIVRSLGCGGHIL